MPEKYLHTSFGTISESDIEPLLHYFNPRELQELHSLVSTGWLELQISRILSIHHIRLRCVF